MSGERTLNLNRRRAARGGVEPGAETSLGELAHQSAPDCRELYLARLVLLLMGEVGDRARIERAIAAALEEGWGEGAEG